MGLGDQTVNEPKRFALLSAAVLTAGLLAACGGGGSGGSSDEAPTPAPAPATPGSAPAPAPGPSPAPAPAPPASAPATVTVAVGSKIFELPVPTSISSLPDTSPADLTTDSTASLWSLVAGVDSLGNTSSLLSNSLEIASVPWPVTFKYWSKGTNNPVNDTGCQIDLAGSALIVTVDGKTISASIDGIPTVRYDPVSNLPFRGDVLITGAGERTVGVRSITRRVQIEAFEGDSAGFGPSNNIILRSRYDPFGFGYTGELIITVNDPVLIQYRCFDTPTAP